MTYNVYWYSFEGYKGKKLTDYTRGEYEGKLYKIGVQFDNGDKLNRIKENSIRDRGVKPTWTDVWETIECKGCVRGFNSKVEAMRFEREVLDSIDKKRFGLHENVSGITEFRIATPETFDTLSKMFAPKIKRKRWGQIEEEGRAN